MKGCKGFNTKQIEQIMNFNNGIHEKRDKALILLGISTGMRISEILSLKLKDVLTKENNIKEIIQLKRENAKRKLEGASFKLSDYVKTALTDYISEIKHIDLNQALFKSQKANKSISRIQAYRIIRHIADMLNIEGIIGTHSLRKTFAKRAYEAFKGDYFKCQKALRHKSLNSTVSYIPVDEEKIQDELANLPLF